MSDGGHKIKVFDRRRLSGMHSTIARSCDFDASAILTSIEMLFIVSDDEDYVNLGLRLHSLA